MFIFNAKLEDASRLEQTLIGRKHIADWLEKQAMNFAGTGQPLRELLIGPRGSGKTHLLGVLYNRIANQPEVKQKVAIAYMSEDEYGIDTYLDLLVRIFKAFSRLVGTSEEKQRVLQHIEQLKSIAPEQRIAYAERYLLEYLNGRYLLVLIENLNDIFAGIKEEGQSQWRDFIQTHDNTGIVATSQAIFKDVNNRSKPFFGFFHITYLPKLSFDDALELMRKLADYDQRDDLLQHLNTDEGRGNLRAIYELTEGNHRLLVTFYNFLKTDFKCELSRTFLLTLDKLKPYYESFLKLLSHQQQKIVQYLALQRIPQTGSQIAQNCFLQPTTVSKQMSELMRLAYVEAHKEGREAYYEITEPLLRICIEVNEDREGIIKLFVDFLGRLYSPQDLKKGYLRFSLLQDIVTPNLRDTYRDEARYYGRAIEAYVEGWKPSPEQQEKVLSLSTLEERERMIGEMVREADEFDEEKFSNLVGKKEWKAAEEMLFPLLKDEERANGARYLLGYLYKEQNQFDKAEKAYQKVLEIKPDLHEVWCNLGNLYLTQNLFEKAEVVYRKALEIKPDSDDVWHRVGFLCQIQKDFTKAEYAYQKALEINPDMNEAWSNMGNLYKEQNMFDKAEAAIQKSLKIEPNHDNTWFLLGMLYFKQDDFEKAETAYQKALEIKPDNLLAWKILGFMYKRQNQFEKAEAAYRKALEIQPDNPEIWSDLGDLYKEQKASDKAEAAYQKALKINPNEHEAWSGLGGLFEEQKAFDKAEATYQKALEIKPDEHFYWFHLGSLYKEEVQFDKAETAYRKAVEIKPDFYEAWDNLSRLYIETDEWGKAKEAVRQYEKYVPDKETERLMYLSARLGDLEQYQRAAKKYSALSENEYSNLPVLMPLFHAKPDMIKSVLLANTTIGTMGDIANETSVKQILPALIKEESTSLEQLQSAHTALTSLYGQDPRFHYPLKYFSLAIRYYREGDKKALYELTKEERKAFFEWAGENVEDIS